MQSENKIAHEQTGNTVSQLFEVDLCREHREIIYTDLF